eukprot:scaffold92223_cov28-Tisochrysis_lutea.AAC.3
MRSCRLKVAKVLIVPSLLVVGICEIAKLGVCEGGRLRSHALAVRLLRRRLVGRGGRRRGVFGSCRGDTIAGRRRKQGDAAAGRCR